MAKKRRQGGKATVSKDLWIAPRFSIKGPAGERAWDNRPGGPPNSTRYLELADIALGLKKPNPRKKKTILFTHETKRKTEPYVIE
ncbi:MAG TPA: hypothetical protein VFT65_01435 [Candidatus Angelobacter sp.]|nr:hypothetical protein [Candidatus Angelobacter sp.]